VLVNELSSEQIFRLLSTNNNIAARNFHVAPLHSPTSSDDSDVITFAFSAANLPSPTLFLDFLAPGAYGVELKMRLDVTAHLPEGSQLWLEGQFEHGSQEKRQLLLSLFCNTPFAAFDFPAHSLNPLRLLVFVREDKRQGSYDIYVRHLYNDQEVSRIT
jgi:hypothetical protein